MQKTVIKISALLITFFISLGIYEVRYFLDTQHIQDISVVANENSPESAPDKTDLRNAVDKQYGLEPCNMPNPMKQYKYPKKIRAIAIGVVNGWLICGTLPKYPQLVESSNISGEVIVNVLVAETGEITKASVRSGNSLLREATLNAAYQSRTAPILLGGQPVKARGILVYRFDRNNKVSLTRNFPLKTSAQN